MHRHQFRAHPLGASTRRRRPARGLTLVELMISGSLGVVVLVAAVAMLLAAGRMRRNQQLLSDANEEARTALRLLTRSLTSAGAGGSSCAFFDTANTKRRASVVSFKNGTTKLSDPDMPQTPDELVVLRYLQDKRTDLVSPLSTPIIVAPDPRKVPGLNAQIFEDNDSLLLTNFTCAMLLPLKASSLDSGSSIVKLTPKSPADPTLLQEKNLDGTPACTIDPGAAAFAVQLVRYRVIYRPKLGEMAARADLVMETLKPSTALDTNPTPDTTVVLARDIEDFQVQWAYDLGGDGVPDDAYGDIGPTASGVADGLSFARISISARTSAPLIAEGGLVSDPVKGKGKGLYIPGHAKEDLTPFELGLDTDLGGTPKAVNDDGYRHRVMSTVVILKNIAAPRI